MGEGRRQGWAASSLFAAWSHHSKARTMVQATSRPEDGREAKIDCPINQSPGTDYKINHQGKGQVLCYITQPTRFIYPLGHLSLWPSITGTAAYGHSQHSPAGSSTGLRNQIQLPGPGRFYPELFWPCRTYRATSTARGKVKTKWSIPAAGTCSGG